MIVNLDDESRQRIALEGDAVGQARAIWDVKTGRPLPPDAELQPGEGTVLAFDLGEGE